VVYRINRRGLLAATAGVAFVSLAGCGDDDEPADTPGEDLTLRLGFAGASLSPGAAMYTSLPDVLGFWGEKRLTVEITRIEGTSTALQAMVGDKIDVAVVSGEAVVPPIADGQPFVIPYSLSQRGIVTIAAKSDASFSDLNGLAGKTIGVPTLASGAVTFTKAGLTEAGVNAGSVKFVAIGTGAQAANALKAGQVDAVADTDIAIVSFQQSGVPVKVLKNTVADKLVIGVVAATTKDLLSRKKPSIEAWARGVAMATEWMQANPEEAVKLHYRKFPGDKPSGADDAVIATGVAQVKARLENIKAASDGTYGSVRTDQLDYIIKYLTDNGQLKKPVTAAQVYDGSLIEAVNTFDKAKVRSTKAPSS
jgi:NitT/TauT family transport system substrate-binding protein